MLARDAVAVVLQVGAHIVAGAVFFVRHADDGLRAQPLVVGDWLYVYGNSGKLVALTIK